MEAGTQGGQGLMDQSKATISKWASLVDFAACKQSDLIPYAHRLMLRWWPTGLNRATGLAS